MHPPEKKIKFLINLVGDFLRVRNCLRAKWLLPLDSGDKNL